jgi:PTH1 family peptidyl-tRNA hydrolase
MLLVVGLGNPPKKYSLSRHNIGYRCVEALAAETNVRISERAPNSLIGSGTIGGETIILAKPTTYMNESGVAVQSLLRNLRLNPEKLVVIYDDMDLPVGKIRIRPGGGGGGHNGIRSIIGHLGTSHFARIRFGIGRPRGVLDPIGHVLGAFTKTENMIVATAISNASAAIKTIAEEGIQIAMTRHNTNLAVPG